MGAGPVPPSSGVSSSSISPPPPPDFPTLDGTQAYLALLCPQPHQGPALEHGFDFKKFLHHEPSSGTAFRGAFRLYRERHGADIPL